MCIRDRVSSAAAPFVFCSFTAFRSGGGRSEPGGYLGGVRHLARRHDLSVYDQSGGHHDPVGHDGFDLLHLLYLCLHPGLLHRPDRHLIQLLAVGTSASQDLDLHSAPPYWLSVSAQPTASAPSPGRESMRARILFSSGSPTARRTDSVSARRAGDRSSAMR